MKRYTVYLLTLLGVLGSLHIQSAQASDWVYVNNAVDGSSYYFDKDSIIKRTKNDFLLLEGSGSIRTTEHMEAWIKVVTKNGEETKVNSKFYCKDGIYKFTSLTRYNSSGIYTDSPRPSYYPQMIIPDTALSGVFNKICS